MIALKVSFLSAIYSEGYKLQQATGETERRLSRISITQSFPVTQ